MSASRYGKFTFIQPKRKIPPALTDIIHSYKQFENIDGLAYKYYKDATLAWVIMAANPDLFMEFQVKPGTQIRIPFPLSRCWSFLGANGEI